MSILYPTQYYLLATALYSARVGRSLVVIIDLVIGTIRKKRTKRPSCVTMGGQIEKKSLKKL